jgi:hypothetical protein
MAIPGHMFANMQEEKGPDAIMTYNGISMLSDGDARQVTDWTSL